MKVIVDLLTLMLEVSDWKGGLQMRFAWIVERLKQAHQPEKIIL